MAEVMSNSTAAPVSSESLPLQEPPPVLIVGAGISGLALAQALKKSDIPFRIFERDAHIDARGPGWGVTIHWSLAALKSCLPDHIFQKLYACQVDPTISGPTDTGRFLFLDLANAEPKYVIPPAPRLRLNRRMFREALCEGLDIQWGKELVDFTILSSSSGSAKAPPIDNRVEVAFKDGSTALGSLLVGTDGSNSRTRRLLCPDGAWKLEQLPVRLLGVTARLSEEEATPLRAIDPLFFQGCCRSTSTYLWFSILSTPAVNNSSGSTSPYYEAQINISWKVDGVNVAEEEAEVLRSDAERLAKMKALAQPFDPRLRILVESIPSGTPVVEIKLQDWPSVSWLDQKGRVTLVGDAAHTMTMYRGEGANHAITDVQQLHSALISIYKGEVGQEAGIGAFEARMRERTRDAVLLSREACLDAHDLEALRDDSPVVSKRAIVRKKAIASNLVA